jgi:hypothetical protein
MLNCEKWIALRNAAMSAVRFQEGSIPKKTIGGTYY